MLTTTQAIVLSVRRCNDKSSIVCAYTRACGRANYIMYGRRFAPRPLMPVEITYDAQPTRDIQTIKSIDFEPMAGYDNSPSAIVRDCVRMFVAELVQSLLVLPMEDSEMFDFLWASVADIAECDDPQNVHLRFMVGLAMRLGFGEPEVDVPTSRTTRQLALQTLCAYFAQHVEGFEPPKSLDVLMEVFD